MLIERDRYLDSLLTALTIEERSAVSDVLARALNDVIAVLREKRATTDSGSRS